MLTSQLGDITKEISVFGELKSILVFLKDYFGFHHSSLDVVSAVLIVFPFVLASLFAYFIGVDEHESLVISNSGFKKAYGVFFVNFTKKKKKEIKKFHF